MSGSVSGGDGFAYQRGIGWHDVVLWLLMLTPVVAAAALEDYTHKIKAVWRQSASVLTAAWGSALMCLSVQSLGLPLL